MVPPLMFLGSFAAATPAGVDQESTKGVETKAAVSFVAVAGRVATRDLCSGDLLILAYQLMSSMSVPEWAADSGSSRNPESRKRSVVILNRAH